MQFLGVRHIRFKTKLNISEGVFSAWIVVETDKIFELGTQDKRLQTGEKETRRQVCF